MEMAACLPVGKHYKVTMNAHCHKLVPALFDLRCWQDEKLQQPTTNFVITRRISSEFLLPIRSVLVTTTRRRVGERNSLVVGATSFIVSGEAFCHWGETRTKIPDRAATQVGPFPCSMAM